jgi:hypothetical protein
LLPLFSIILSRLCSLHVDAVLRVVVDDLKFLAFSCSAGLTQRLLTSDADIVEDKW